MLKKILLFSVLVVVSLGAGYQAYQWQLDNQNILLDNHGYAGGDFTLKGAEGEVSLSDFRGQPVLMYFGYAFCPDVCPGSLAIMGKAISLLEADGITAQGIFVSVDPARDTPEKLKKYAAFFHPDMLGLTSDEHRILELATRYGVFYQKAEIKSESDYLLDHSSRYYLINATGKLAALLPHGSSVDEIADKVRQL